jgi:hypothetical protein
MLLAGGNTHGTSGSLGNVYHVGDFCRCDVLGRLAKCQRAIFLPGKTERFVFIGGVDRVIEIFGTGDCDGLFCHGFCPFTCRVEAKRFS